MKLDDQQLGKPERLYKDTKTNVEALSLAAGDEGCAAYATDTDKLGLFDGAAWTWITTGSTGIGLDGWIAADAMTYASADDPTYTMTCAGDKTTTYYAGQRIKLTQSTGGTKYFIVTKVAYSSSTTITIYGGTDYNLENEAISNPYYSLVKAPAGFPLDATKWTVRTADTGLRTQAAPVNGTWYNLGTVSISIPIGCWRVGYQVVVQGARGEAGWVTWQATLSTGNNTESDTEFSSYGTAEDTQGLAALAARSKFLTLTAKTAYYLNTSAQTINQTDIYNRGDLCATVVEAVCAYL